MLQTYTPPVSRLLNYQECQSTEANEWPDYVSEFGFTHEHIPELVRLMRDVDLYEWESEEEDDIPEGLDPDLAWCGPIHAWRALGQLKATEFLDGALDILDSRADEWAMEEFPQVCQMIGPDIIPPLGALIKENVTTDKDIVSLIESLFSLPEEYPEARDRCAAILQDALQTYRQNSKLHNTFLVLGLQTLRVTEALDLLEAVYQEKRVDELFVGTWARAQIILGLKTEADFTQEELTPEVPPEMQQMQDLLELLERQQKPDAFALGMPVDPSHFPSTKPPEFDDLVKPKTAAKQSDRKGFGGAQKSSKKTKKKK